MSDWLAAFYNMGNVTADHVADNIADIPSRTTVNRLEQKLDALAINVGNLVTGETKAPVVLRSTNSNSQTVVTKTAQSLQDIQQYAQRQQVGMNAETGKVLSGINHIHQSIKDILTTYLLERVINREYGSDLHKKIDRPTNSNTILQVYASITSAIRLHEQRVTLQRINATRTQSDDKKQQGAMLFSVFWALKEDYLWLDKAGDNHYATEFAV